MQKRNQRNRTSKEEILLHIKNWRESGLTMSAYSRQVNLPIYQLSKWVRSQESIKPNFKPVNLIPSLGSMAENQPIEIIVNDRIKIRLPITPDSAMIVTSIVRGMMPCS